MIKILFLLLAQPLGLRQIH